MQCAMLNWNGVPTQVITEGRWVEEGFSNYGKREVVIIIPGNPGLAEFYKGFIKTVKSKLPTEVPVWIISHAGHVQPPNNLAITMPSNSNWTEHYSLMTQVQHKIDFIKKYVPEDVKIHLIGHSIGCWIILNMLKDNFIAKQVTKCYLLFPTIENMDISDNGWWFTKVVSRVAFFLLFCAWIISNLPYYLQIFIISIAGILYRIPFKYNNVILNMLNPYSLERIIKMAKEEMIEVKKRDDDIISKCADKLWFYYGNCDGWVPIKYYKNLKSNHPYINAELCKHGYHHSFVLQYDKEVGNIVGNLISENIS
ncbi:lipid droplet-associated hydrolase [Apis mellifera carnica]|nr:lipid droplet-associated hydrolase [Apis mellifera carnica]